MVRKLEQYIAEQAKIAADDRNLVSRTEERRERQRIEAQWFTLATRLTTLKGAQLGRLALPDPVFEILDEIRVIESAPARTRAIKRLRAELRDMDLEFLARQIAALDDPRASRPVNEETAWHERLTSGGDPALAEFLERFPSADRAQIRSLVRNATHAEGSARTRANARLARALGQAIQSSLRTRLSAQKSTSDDA